MTEISRIKFQPLGKNIWASYSETVLEAAVRGGIQMRADCGGKGVCGKCRVIAEPAEHLFPLTETEKKQLTPRQIEEGYRLACETRISGPVTVTLTDDLADAAEVRGKDGLTGRWEPAPLTRRFFLPKSPPPEPEASLSGTLSEWVTERLEKETGEVHAVSDACVIRQLTRPRRCFGEMTVVTHRQNGITALLEGRRNRRLGLSVDLGTTTLAGYLCDMETGELLTSASAVNPQRRYGEDVISRIAFANDHENGLKDLQSLAVKGINALIRTCTDAEGLQPQDIEEITVAGNTTMEQIFAGFHPNCLGVTPYLPAVRTFPGLCAEELGLMLNPGTPVYPLPVISGFVGGDALGAALAHGPHRTDGVSLVVDIGTNGELVISGKNGLWATSCATGPALEGAQISCGMRAVSGAVHRVWVTEEGAIDFAVLGEGAVRPRGICGSGIIDAIASFRKAGILEPDGKFNPDHPEVVCDASGFGRKYVLVPADESGPGEEVAVTLKDVRQIQLAKAALCVGIEFLMERAGISEIDRTLLTGAFGARFDWKNAVTIGMFPSQATAGTVTPKENLAGIGAVMTLLNRKYREEAEALARKIRFIELSGDTRFAMRFALATRFPDIESS